MTKEEYERLNPLGGIASMFETIARRLRAGEPLESVLDDYGLEFKDKEAA